MTRARASDIFSNEMQAETGNGFAIDPEGMYQGENVNSCWEVWLSGKGTCLSGARPGLHPQHRIKNASSFAKKADLSFPLRNCHIHFFGCSFVLLYGNHDGQ